MRVLHVNSSDKGGGAAIAAFRLNAALNEKNVESQLLVQSKFTDNKYVIGSESKLFKFLALVRPSLDQLRLFFYNKKRKKKLFSPNVLPFSPLVKKINKLNPQIVHLHWVCGGALKIEDLKKIKAPIVMTLHDSWFFTGGCHIHRTCEKYKVFCGKCPVLNSDIENDLSRIIIKRKAKVYKKLGLLNVIGVSRWIYNCAKESRLLKNHNLIQLPNSIPTDIFKPISQHESQKLWNLSSEKKYILFGSFSPLSNEEKGLNELRSALKLLQCKFDIELLIFGASEPVNEIPFGYKANYFSELHDQVSMVALYNAADILVVPSLSESFGLTAAEAMACGTPVVAFNATGLVDIIDHKQNGYLAKPYEPADLAFGMQWCLEYENFNELKNSAIRKIEKKFSSEVVARLHIDFYQDVLKKQIKG